jgi:opacity protein-like surface antigen
MLKSITVAVAVLASTISLAHANDAIERANNQVTFSVGANHLNYREIDTTGVTGGGDLDSEKGTQAAFQFSATRQFNAFNVRDLYTQASVSYARGHTSYNGYLQGYDALGNFVLEPFQNNTTSSTVDVNLKVGKGFRFGPASRAQLTPYVAYGYHNWVRDMQGQYGYKETYSHHTLGGGLMGQYALTDRLVATVDGSAAALISPKMSADLFGDFTLKAKAQEQLVLGLDYAVTRNLHVSGSYRLTHFEYGHSDVNNGMYEPDSKSTQQLFLVGLGYAF